jgi:hypothetical protein
MLAVERTGKAAISAADSTDAVNWRRVVALLDIHLLISRMKAADFVICAFTLKSEPSVHSRHQTKENFAAIERHAPLSAFGREELRRLRIAGLNIVMGLIDL